MRSGVRHKLARVLPSSAWAFAGVAERAEGRIYPELADLAAAEPADLFIGHYPAGLAAAAHAARCHDAMLGYDVEDLYAETFPDGDGWATEKARVVRLEERYVPSCAYVSAVSSPVKDEFVRRYSMRTDVVVVHNCHPWRERETIDRQIRDRRGPSLSLYWYSQVIGLDRGIQDAIRAGALLPTRPQIHLRGDVDGGVREALTLLARDSGRAVPLHFHAAVAPDELLSRACEHDIGLALERADSLNKALTASNKIFLYLTAGLAIVATDTPGQRSTIDEAPRTGALYKIGDHFALAAHLHRWQMDDVALAAAKDASLEAARVRWNWESEARVIADAVERLLAHERTALAMR
jgi:glycosyltransferase involved in cell wall biosynthesis